MFSLADAEARRGVVTHSSGNHGAALAYAARQRGIAAWVVMPENAPKVKQENVRRFGATIRFCAPNVAAREAACAAIEAETGATLIHPFDDARVIAGQGTAALELLEAVPDLDIVIAPVGGGGLLSGTAIAARALRPAMRVYGAEPANADDAARSFRSGRVEPLPATVTIADGLRTTLSRADAGGDPRQRRRDRHGQRGRDRAGDAHDLGADEDRDRAVVGGAAGVPARAHARRRGRQGRRDRLGRQRRPRPAALAAIDRFDDGFAPEGAPLLDVRGVTLQYKTRDHLVTATYRVDFQVFRSDRYVLLGPSGCGKSTLLKAVGGYMTPVEGEIRLKGEIVTRPGPRPDDGVPGIRPAAAVEDGHART